MKNSSFFLLALGLISALIPQFATAQSELPPRQYQNMITATYAQGVEFETGITLFRPEGWPLEILERREELLLVKMPNEPNNDWELGWFSLNDVGGPIPPDTRNTRAAAGLFVFDTKVAPVLYRDAAKQQPFTEIAIIDLNQTVQLWAIQGDAAQVVAQVVSPDQPNVPYPWSGWISLETLDFRQNSLLPGRGRGNFCVGSVAIGQLATTPDCGHTVDTTTVALTHPVVPIKQNRLPFKAYSSVRATTATLTVYNVDNDNWSVLASGLDPNSPVRIGNGFWEYGPNGPMVWVEIFPVVPTTINRKDFEVRQREAEFKGMVYVADLMPSNCQLQGGWNHPSTQDPATLEWSTAYDAFLPFPEETTCR